MGIGIVIDIDTDTDIDRGTEKYVDRDIGHKDADI